MAPTGQTDQTAAAVVEWSTYREAPSGNTLARLQNALNRIGRLDSLLPGLHKLFIATGQWKIAQHLALLFESSAYSVHAMYFAHKARVLSGGDPLARLMLAKVVWMRRLPGAVLYQTSILRIQARRIKSRAQKLLLQLEIAELNLKAYSYLQDVAAMRRWLRFLEMTGKGSIDTVLQLLFGARSIESQDMRDMAARRLAPHIEQFGGRVKTTIEIGVRSSFLNVLRARR